MQVENAKVSITKEKIPEIPFPKDRFGARSLQVPRPGLRQHLLFRICTKTTVQLAPIYEVAYLNINTNTGTETLG